MKRKHLLILVILSALAGAVLGTTRADAQTVSDIQHVDVDGDGTVEWCVGNQTIADAPYQCEAARDYTISGVKFRVSVVATFNADGTGTAQYFLSRKLPQPVPIRVRAHTGISSTGPTLFDTEADGADFIAVGSTTATLAFTFTCGQVDIKAVFVAPGNSLGRIMGPYVCSPPPPTVPTTAPTSATGPTTVPVPSTSPSGPGSSTPGSSGPVASSARALPATGGSDALSYAALAAVLLGAIIVLLARRHPEDA